MPHLLSSQMVARICCYTLLLPERFIHIIQHRMFQTALETHLWWVCFLWFHSFISTFPIPVPSSSIPRTLLPLCLWLMCLAPLSSVSHALIIDFSRIPSRFLLPGNNPGIINLSRVNWLYNTYYLLAYRLLWLYFELSGKRIMPGASLIPVDIWVVSKILIEWHLIK